MPKPYFLSEQEILNNILRVNHAGEYAAIRIYEGQLACAKDKEFADLIKHMMQQEREHLKYFDQILLEYKVRPTILLPIWHLMAYSLGYLSTVFDKKIAMLLTHAVEEVIEEHYNKQIEMLTEYNLGNKLIINLQKFRTEEIEHKKISEQYYNKTTFLDFFLEENIKFCCKVGIKLSLKL